MSQTPSLCRPYGLLGASSSSSCAFHKHDDDEYTQVLSLPPNRGPTKALLANLTHLAATKRRDKGAKQGKVIGKAFNPQASRPRPSLSSPLREFSVCMTQTSQNFTTSTTLPTFASFLFALSQFAAVSEYTALFDEYRIDFLEAWLDPSLIMSPTAGSTMFHSVVDLDDANVPAAGADVTARQGCVSSETGTGHYHRWRPYVANALYSGVFTSFGSEPSQFIDCASPGVQHYGLKVAIPAADGVARQYTLTVRAMVTFRGPAI